MAAMIAIMAAIALTGDLPGVARESDEVTPVQDIHFAASGCIKRFKQRLKQRAKVIDTCSPRSQNNHRNVEARDVLLERQVLIDSEETSNSAAASLKSDPSSTFSHPSCFTVFA